MNTYSTSDAYHAQSFAVFKPTKGWKTATIDVKQTKFNIHQKALKKWEDIQIIRDATVMDGAESLPPLKVKIRCNGVTLIIGYKHGYMTVEGTTNNFDAKAAILRTLDTQQCCACSNCSTSW